MSGSRGVACGSVPDQVQGPTLDFVEPCLAFAASPLDGYDVELRVYLSLEAEPPFVVAGAAGRFENYVPLCMGLPVIEAAATEWGDGLRTFPVRGGNQ
ncbi:hypothetical protein WG915_09540 [Corynebacterium sp. H128]|uniref:hypothetical protein n=1 Tax=Corynebacterium sp. H128 TaxID=3133427 RepID=UPI0030AD5183